MNSTRRETSEELENFCYKNEPQLNVVKSKIMWRLETMGEESASKYENTKKLINKEVN